MLNRRLLLTLLLITLVSHLTLLVSLPQSVQLVGILLFTGLIPGVLWVEWLVGRSKAPPPLTEYLLYAIGLAYSNLIILMLLVHYLPGPVAVWQTLVAFDGVTLVLWLLLLRGAEQVPPVAVAEPTLIAADGEAAPQLPWRGWIVVGGLVLLLVGGFFRLSNLGYSEFQGDEARAALRAAAVIQGYDDVLFIHKKGPTEILLPTVSYSLTGTLTETTARLPFALANLAALFAIWLLGWRLIGGTLGALAGWVAAFLLAFDGYWIGFSHIVQYQSIVILVSALAVLLAYRLLRRPEAMARYLIVAAILLATGLLSHYEAAQAAVPVGFLLLALLWQQPRQWARLLLATIPALLVGAILLAAFYLPFVLHPNFQATYTYLVDRRVGAAFPYNNLADFFLRSTVYNSSYFVLLMIALVVIALLRAYARYLPRALRYLGMALVVATTVLAFWRPTALTIGGQDWMIVPFALAFLLVCLLPRLRTEERTLWLWFGAPLLIAFFLTEKPRTHVYIFFTAWALLVGMVVAQGWRSLQQRTNRLVAVSAGVLTVLVATVVFGSYAYWYFVHTETEVLHTWEASHPAGYWVPYTEPDDKAIFGFPLANGWKVIGALYAQGVMQGDYETNEKEAWVPAWYTRGQQRCQRTAQWYFQIDNLEPFAEGDRLYMEHILRQGFEKWGKVVINGDDRMIIYQRTGAQLEFPSQQPNDALPVYALADYAPRFDQGSQPQFPLTYPEVNQPIGNPLHINLGDEIWLEGYDIDYPQPLRPNDSIYLTLYWRAQKVITTSYKVFNQSYYGDGTMIAQQDGYPVCETRETWRWDPGELITDQYEIPVKADAPDGLYPFYTGLYLEETLDRLRVIDEAGNVIGDQVHLTDIRVGVE
ncbi:MAG: glycosyltransferase family 39 protein [Caldilineaceae bacterium]|nr:glycosyltransferase family 39 protein [Caldilineaceae bacterium]